MRSDCLIYLSGPITPLGQMLIEDHISAALGEWLELIRHDVPAICVHLGAAFPSCYEIPYETWMAYDLAILDHCTHILMLDGWSKSKGAQLERIHALGKGMPVLYSVQEVLDVLEAKDKWVKETE